MPTDASSGAVVEADMSQLVPPSDRKHVGGGGGGGTGWVRLILRKTDGALVAQLALVLIVRASCIFVSLIFTLFS